AGPGAPPLGVPSRPARGPGGRRIALPGEAARESVPRRHQPGAGPGRLCLLGRVGPGAGRGMVARQRRAVEPGDGVPLAGRARAHPPARAEPVMDALDVTVHLAFAFDVGYEIDLERARPLLAGESGALPRRRRTPESIRYRPAPLRVTLDGSGLALP